MRAQTADIRVRRDARKIRAGDPEYQSIYRIATSRERSDLLESEVGQKMGFRGGVGPKAMAEGRLSYFDWATTDITRGPIDYGRRPEQASKPFQLTEEATAFMNRHSRLNKYRAYEASAQQLGSRNAWGPSMRVLYVNPESANLNLGGMLGGRAELLERIAMEDGEALMRDSLARELRFESTGTAKIKLLRDDLDEDAIRKLLPGDIIGVDEQGVPLRMQEGMRVTGFEELESPGMGKFGQVSYIQEHEFEHGSKVFGSAKAVVHRRGPEEFRDIVQEVTGRGGKPKWGKPMPTPEYDMIVSMEELKKNRALHRRQMLTALSEITAENMNAQRKGANSLLRQLAVRDVGGASERFLRSAIQDDVYSHKRFIENVMRFAVKTAGITPTQFQEVFGAVPYVRGEEETRGMIKSLGLSNKMQQRYMRKLFDPKAAAGYAAGVGTFAFAGPAIDVGGLGSIEPRTFEILSQPQFGRIGGDIGEEFMQRLHATSPDVLQTHKELGRTLASIGGELERAPGETFKASAGYNYKAFQELMEEGSFVIDPGKGQRPIYVPSAKALSDEALGGLRGFETGGGKVVRSHLGAMYHDLGRVASRFAQGEIGIEEYKATTRNIADQLRREWAPYGKGGGSVTRGKMLGSTFLRGMSATQAGAETAIREVGTVGISLDAFERMQQQMVRAGYDEAGMTSMREAFERGDKVGAMLWRHPEIGGFSMQYTNIVRAEGAGATDIVLPEVGVNIRARAGEEEVAKRIKLGPLIGMAGDKDADAYAVALVSPDNEKAIRKMTEKADNAFATRYTQHQVRMQLFKAKAASEEGITTLAKMAGDVEKLAVGQEWVGKLSTQLSAAKEALSAGGRGAAAADARALIEWLEQTPISSKHLTAAEAKGGGFGAAMATLASAMETGNRSRMRAAVEAVVESNAMSTAMLTQNVELREGAEDIAKIMNVNLGTRLEGVNLEAATGEMMRTMSDHHANGGMRAYQRLVGRGSRIKLTEIPEMLAKGVGNAKGAATGTMSKVVSAAQAANNMMGQIGKGIVKHHKAIGLGFVGSVALASALSSPKDSIGPGGAMIPKGKLNMNRSKAASRMSPETVAPGSPPMGNPTPPNMLQSRQARVSMGSPGRTTQIRASAGANVNVQGIAGAATSLGGRSNVNLRDSRSQPYPHEIANKVL
jgi:hypothetical protein